MQSNSRSQPTPRVGNMSGRRRDVIPDITGSSQPTSRVGNLSKRRHNAVLDTMGSSQPTPGAGNLNRRTHDVVRANKSERAYTRRRTREHGIRVRNAAARIRQLPQYATEQPVIKSEFFPTTNWRPSREAVEAPTEEHNSDDRIYRTRDGA